MLCILPLDQSLHQTRGDSPTDRGPAHEPRGMMYPMQPTPPPDSPRKGDRKRVTVADVPHMLERYSPDNPVPPTAVAAGSNKRFRWICPEGSDHQWEAQANSIRASTRGGCPFCAGKRPSVTNRLDILHPALAEEWAAALNGGPAQVVAGSERKAWWRCRTCAHEWQANIRNRTVLQAGCPRCAAAKTSKRLTRPAPGRCLAEAAPYVARSWHPELNGSLTPDDVAVLSSAPRWWWCLQGHSWQISPAGRVSKGGAGCPYCSGRVATAETSLQTQRPDLAAQWHPTRNARLTPLEVKPSSSTSVWWQCPEGHDYRSRVANRTHLGRGCPYCSGQTVGYGNDLQTQAPAIAAEWDQAKNGATTPSMVTTGVQRQFWWRCADGHSWRATVASRVGQGTGCPVCQAGWRRSKPEIGLQFELAHVLGVPVQGDAPVQTTSGPMRVDVLCPDLGVAVEYDGSHWHADTFERDTSKSQALMDAGWLVIRVRQHPLPLVGPWDVACEEGDPDVYTMVCSVLRQLRTAGPEVPVGHPLREVSTDLPPRIDAYLLAGSAQATAEADAEAARTRVERKAQRRLNVVPRPAPGRSLAELSPVIAAEWHPTLNGDLTPLDVSNARNARAWWHCSICGSDWEARINERTRRQNVGCPTCGRGRTAAARMRPESGRSLADLYPDIAVQWHPGRNAPLGPNDVRPGSHKRVWWQDATGREWQAAVFTRIPRRQSGSA